MAPNISTRMSKHHQNHKKHIIGCQSKEVMAIESSCELCYNEDDFKGKEILDNACSTPKGKRFKISETLICPSAPKKRRLTTICSSKRSCIEFFTPPELEIFFLCAFRNNV
ncbi:hypothetical protein Pfo_029672 [Paulownia fortunei]|nr:hypothetical protein Pfo_029672 [Paulownia fortunei]